MLIIEHRMVIYYEHVVQFLLNNVVVVVVVVVGATPIQIPLKYICLMKISY
jgi:hypothetical protein